MNTYGKRFRVTTFGESHGEAIGMVIDGCPAGRTIDTIAINEALARRRAGAPRPEQDELHFLSGLKDGRTLGTPIACIIANTNTRPADYDALADCSRPGHADYTYMQRYGLRDHRGGGRASARETTMRVVAGSIARQMMPQVDITAEASVPLPERADDTRGGIVSCRITGVKAGVGTPLFGKLNAQLAAAMLSIPSAIGFEMGSGFEAARMYGSEYVDQWSSRADGSTTTNHCGGIQGGISNGMPIEFRVAFHPTPTLPREVACLTEDGQLRPMQVSGRHDRCAVLRAPVIVESMGALCLAQYLL